MPLVVIGDGQLAVRQRRRFVKGAGGVFTPRLFRAEDTDFTDAPAMAALGQDLIRERGILTSQTMRWTPPTATPDQEWAHSYHEACKALDKTPAGKRAEELLMSLLTPDQEKTARLYRYIDYFLIHKKAIDGRMVKGEIPNLACAAMRFKRGYPNGNIKLGRFSRGRPIWLYTICYHPTVPYPTDDIVVAQIMAMLSNPDEFVQKGNVTSGVSGGPFHFKYMYEPAPKPPKLVLPYGVTHSQEIKSVSRHTSYHLM